MHQTLHIAEETLANRAVYRVRSRTRPTPQARVIYFHGGAYVRPIFRFHWQHLAALAHATGCEYVVPLYPLAPESQGLAALEFAQKVYRRESIHGDKIVLMGDSTRANLEGLPAMTLFVAGRDILEPDAMAFAESRKVRTAMAEAALAAIR